MSGRPGRSGGSNRLPLALHQLKGTRPRRRPVAAAGRAAADLSTLPPATKPATLSSGAALVWDELAPLTRVTAADAPAFATLVELVATLRQVAAQKTSALAPQTVKLECAVAAALRPYLALFHLTPVDRARAWFADPPAGPSPSSTFARLLAARPSKWSDEIA
jgi:hypothetical protein